MTIIVIRKQTLLLFVLIFLIAVASAVGCLALRPSLSTYITDAAATNTKHIILINIEEKRLYLFEEMQCIKEYPIATGMPGWPSPIGQWKIVEKSNWGEGFGGYWLGLNVLWGTYGIHGTTRENSIGRAESHGCIRMYIKDIRELYQIVSIGTHVIIRNGEYGAFGTGFRSLVPGDRGADVLAVQQRLKELGYFRGKETGIYDDRTKNALYSFQRDRRLAVKYTITRADYRAMGFSEIE